MTILTYLYCILIDARYIEGLMAIILNTLPGCLQGAKSAKIGKVLKKY